MNKYSGKNCPYCKTAFQLEDEIVVCSACEMPHHKDCWIENQGCTTFGCTGTINTVNNAASSVTATRMNYEDAGNGGFVFCTNCGTKNARTSAFCTNCGHKLTAVTQRAPQPPVYTQSNPANTNPYAYVNQPQNPYQQQNAYQPQNPYQQQNAYQPQNPYQQQNAYQPQNPYQQQNAYQPQNPYQQHNAGYSGYQSYQTDPNEAELQQLVGTKTEYYMPRFRELKVATKKVSWNWAAFLIAPFWLMYRKMYAYGAAVLGVNFLISVLSQVTDGGFSAFLSMLSIGGSVACGLFANIVYLNHLDKKAREARIMSEPMKSQFLTSNGGVNITAAILSAVGYFITVLLVL